MRAPVRIRIICAGAGEHRLTAEVRGRARRVRMACAAQAGSRGRARFRLRFRLGCVRSSGPVGVARSRCS